MANVGVGSLDNKERHASDVEWRLEPLIWRSPVALRDCNVANLVKVGAVEHRVSGAAVDWLLTAEEFEPLGYGFFRGACSALGKRSALRAGEDAHVCAGRRVAVEVQRDEVPAAHLAAGNGVDPVAVHECAARDGSVAFRHVVLVPDER